MASAILSPFLDLIFGNLASVAVQELQQVWGADVEKELRNLKSTLSAIQAVLEDAEERQFHSKVVQDWLRKLKEVAYDADDLVDEVVAEAGQSKRAEIGTDGATAGSKKRKLRVWDYFSSLFNSSQQDMASRIREINVRLDQIAKEKRALHLKTRHGSKQLEITREQQRRLSSSVRDESSQFLGREDDTEQMITSLLSDNSSKRNFSVIAIVGMGGLGKTTLAQVVYNDKRVTEKFEIKAWVCVSEHFDAERLTKEILASASWSTHGLSNFNNLQCCLRDKLNGKRFLLVLDDVWNKDDREWEQWEQLQTPLTFGAKGSKIVVTTRSQTVSNTMQATCIHNLKCLSKQDCWSLFVSETFKDESIDSYPGLVKIGQKLVKKCGGLPLAAKALSGLLWSKREVREWETILQSPIWSLTGPASSILPALRLSYQHLPAHLKHCFTFCSVFPKNYKFEKEKLVHLWVAHGFIQPQEGKQIEDTGFEYFNDLFQRSFFKPQSFHGRVRYKMHDLIHDLAQFISGDECFQMEHGQSHIVLRKTRHLSYSAGYNEQIDFRSFYELKGLRTFLLTNALAGIDEKVLDESFERLRFIRVLDLSDSNIGQLPNSIGNLKHLRYLNLSWTDIKELPGSICSIYNLQTLLLRDCKRLVELPNEMRELINLRHLDLSWCYSLASMPPQIGRLTCLQTLPRFVVGGEKKRGIAELKELMGIHGMLGIERLENVAEARDARGANLKGKPFIDRLQLMWSGYHSNSLQNEKLEEIANGLQPHTNLKRLEFWSYMGSQFPSWMMEMDMLKLLSNLTTLDLKNCRRCNILPPLGCLPSLSNLHIRKIEQVKWIGHEFCGIANGGFPSLKELYLEEMLNLEEWHENEGAFNYLERLKIIDCPQLRQLPNFNHLPNLTNLEINRCASLVSLQMPFNHLPNLTDLRIAYCSSLVSLPRLPSLKKLRLDDLGNLEEWCDVAVAVAAGEAHFPCLEHLTIEKCPKMKRWPNFLPALTELSVIDCQGLNELPPLLSSSLSVLELCGAVSERLLNSVSFLNSLSSLTINGIPSLASMPEGILQALTQLKELRISSCDELVTLQDEVLPSSLANIWLYRCPSLQALPRTLHALTSLHTLETRRCPHLKSFPDQGLPSSLQRLVISRNPVLKERCLKDVGEDWPKISHIPDLELEAPWDQD